ncbi:TetR/AcrR family transcriptional regulator [Nitratireductor soli]|uniref:TetR/AcrR family transcriptional regulator n=1 Tax=Nitratireductor soli TaxID=1670619 RepID=UPI0009E6225F|nr:TetR/AcrR family transcriptional regulator [Nitratireductor soli]
MPKTVDETKHAARRQMFLDCAEHLLQTVGYDRLSIQDILNATGVSKGAFYHYFDSKQDLLEALVDQTSQAIAENLAPISDDEDLAAVEKLQRFFATLAAWKSARRDLLENLLGVWLADENALLREKQRHAIARRIAPLFARIIEQGAREGVFASSYPEQEGWLVVSIIQDLNAAMASLIVSRDPQASDQAKRLSSACQEGVARIIGIDPQTFALVEPHLLSAWFGSSNGKDSQ